MPPSSWLGAGGGECDSNRSPGFDAVYSTHRSDTAWGDDEVHGLGAAPSVLHNNHSSAETAGNESMGKSAPEPHEPSSKHAHGLILTRLLARLKGRPACHVAFDVKLLR